MALTGLIYNTSKDNDREQWRRTLAEAGLTLVDGSFEEGATLGSATDAVWYIAGAQCYTWGSGFPKGVPPKATPASTGGIGLGAWASVGDASLRSNLASLSVDNGDKLIAVKFPSAGASDRTQHDKNSDTISLKDFGAVGDGITDDSLAIKNAIASANGRKIVIPTGKYKLLSYLELPSNCHLFGDGDVEFYLDPSITTGADFGGIGRAVFAIDKSNISFENITFSSSKTGLTKSITIGFLNCKMMRVTNCTFKDFGDSTYYAQGLIMFGCTDITIENSTFDNCSGDGAALSNGCLRYTVKGCTFSHNLDWGLALVSMSHYGSVTSNLFLNNVSTATGVERCSYVNFIGNTMINNEHGVRVCEFIAGTADKSEYITIVGNNINSSAVGVSIEEMRPTNGNFTVSGNVIINSSDHGVRIIHSAEGTITGNEIFSTANAAILLQNTDAGKVTGSVSISGNNIRACKWGIREILTDGNLAYNSVGINNIQDTSVESIAVTTNTQYIDASQRGYITVSNALKVPSGIVSNTASAGGITTPAQVQGYIIVNVGGTDKKVPFYN